MYVVGSHCLFKNHSFHCLQCRKLRRAVAKRVLGASRTLQTFQNAAAYSWVQIDVLGPLKAVEKKRGARLKLWLLLTRCLSTGHTSITPMMSMPSKALLQALQQAWYGVGCTFSHTI